MDSRRELFTNAFFALSDSALSDGKNLDKTIERVKQVLEKYQYGLGSWGRSCLDDYWQRLETLGLPEWRGHEVIGAIRIMLETNEKYALKYPSFDVSMQLMEVLYLLERYKESKRTGKNGNDVFVKDE